MFHLLLHCMNFLPCINAQFNKQHFTTYRTCMQHSTLLMANNYRPATKLLHLHSYTVSYSQLVAIYSYMQLDQIKQKGISYNGIIDSYLPSYVLAMCLDTHTCVSSYTCIRTHAQLIALPHSYMHSHIKKHLRIMTTRKTYIAIYVC